jgi:hypothetical protein
MNNNQQIHKPTVVPYQWWVTGVCADLIYVYCPSTRRVGVIEDPTPTELSRAQCINIADNSYQTIPDASYRWEDVARVRALDTQRVDRSGHLLRDTLKAILEANFSQLQHEARAQARRTAIEALDGLILRLDRLELIPWLVELERRHRLEQEEDEIPF